MRQRRNPHLWRKIKPAIKEMRTQPTYAEDSLWQKLRDHQVKSYHFRRQHKIDHYIVDFYCHKAKLVIEVDGTIHETQHGDDAIRQQFIEERGLTVIRFTNDEVLTKLETVIQRVEEYLL